ncbi:hypothetical protein CJ030_MR3G007105 [Morella rubra]|uniref:Uncharacterized protein n=1 Tax=Morella rubra TaxID=262757 RepID=A0A6A1W4A2_9ROSI|nr:hypothetical protein CJ030_MR3G007105 [Morella rubra]
MEVTVQNVQIIFSPDELALFLGYVRDVTAFPNVPMTEEGRPTKAEFLHNLMVPEGDEPRALPLGSINKTTLSKSMAQTRRVLGAARAARARREEPAQGTEEQDPGQGSSQDSRDSAELGGVYDDRVD